MKKNAVLIVLFILPLVVYLFFATGVNSFIHLPTLTPKTQELPSHWKSLNGEPTTLQDKISILGFSGNNILDNRGNYFLFNQKIYTKYREFKDFQVVFVAPEGTQKDVQTILDRLSKLTDVTGYHFVFAPENEIKDYFNQLELLGSLNSELGTSSVYILDKERSIRGRKGKSKKGESEYKEGYNINSSAELHNEMTDDVKILLAEYRLALKKNNANRKI